MAQDGSYVFKYDKLKIQDDKKELITTKNLKPENCYVLVSVQKDSDKLDRKQNKINSFDGLMTSWFNQDSYRNALFYHFFELHNVNDDNVTKAKTYRWIQYYIQKLYWIRFIRNSGEILLEGKSVTFEFSPRPDLNKLSWHELSWIIYQMEVFVKKLTLTVKTQINDITDLYKTIGFNPVIPEGNAICRFQSKGKSVSYEKAMKECLEKIPEFLTESEEIDDNTDSKIKELMYLRYWYTYLPERVENGKIGDSIFHKMAKNIKIPEEAKKFKSISRKFTKKSKKQVTKNDIDEMINWTSRYLVSLPDSEKKTVDLLEKIESNDTEANVVSSLYEKWKTNEQNKSFPEFLHFLEISGVLHERDVKIGSGAYYLYHGLGLNTPPNFINFMFQHYEKGKDTTDKDTEKRWHEYAKITKYLDEITRED